MFKRVSTLPIFLFILASCYQPERNCQAFRDGEFTFTTSINGEEMTTTFSRHGNLEVDFFQGKKDSSSIRWINDCEYIVKKLHPKNRSEEKSVHMKILTTTDNSYTFEYNIVGQNNKSKGVAIKTN